MPELRHSTEKSCAGSNDDLCAIFVNSECCRESASAATAILCNHQCVVSMRQKMLQVGCNKSAKKTSACLPRKKKSGNRFLDVISWEYDNRCT